MTQGANILPRRENAPEAVVVEASMESSGPSTLSRGVGDATWCTPNPSTLWALGGSNEMLATKSRLPNYFIPSLLKQAPSFQCPLLQNHNQCRPSQVCTLDEIDCSCDAIREQSSFAM
ncbi:hypothetical protein AC1031_004624 [Aphanomyces cochlioides]|nr:hypothetical protein AC1031_004624 [Aphanomyces cochlioides]